MSRNYNYESNNTVGNSIQNGTQINGNIQTNGNIHIDGVLVGTLSAAGTVTIGTSGIIEGDIICNNAEIEGKVTGTIQVKELLSLRNTSIIIGDLITDKLAIEPGARFTGNCKMEGYSNHSSYEYAQAEEA